MTHLLLVGQIAWNPGFRGILVVAVAVIVLMGSVFVLLGTNSGMRLGFMLALTGLFGWMTLMGVVWSIYGIGYKGPAPVWKVKEIVSGDLKQAAIPAARTLPQPNQLPDPIQIRNGSAALLKAFPKEKKDPSLGDLITTDTQLKDQIKKLTGKWHLLATSDKATGETAAVAAEYVGPTKRNLFATTSDYVVLDTFTTGGKPQRTDTSMVGRVLWKLKKASMLKNPPAYAVLELRAAIPQKTKAGQAPPLPVPDPSKPVISVVMERDLGALRLPSFGLTAICGTIFAILANALHRRDKTVARNRAAAAPAGAG
ncbi:MAG: hypothetical protein JWN46_1806 [Acidimicrobiales bacterium]|nr:hypothetical protein [Acidimicrobiales bacterium]